MLITPQFLFLLVIALLLTLAALFADTQACERVLDQASAKCLRLLVRVLLVLTIVGMGFLNFQATLTLAVAGTGLIALMDKLFFHRRRVSAQGVRPYIVETAYSFFGVLLLVWVIRSFIVQPYRVPTGSLMPTVTPGDFLVVKQFQYGLRFPINNIKMVETGEPKRGDIVLFYYPLEPSIVYVKRLIGLPGDHVALRNNVLYINGQVMAQTDLGEAIDDEPAEGTNPEEHLPVAVKEENLMGLKHKIYISHLKTMLNQNFSVVVPKGHYFMMGDNRDNSDDSRDWGFVPEANIIGQAFGVWMSWDALNHRIRWERIGRSVK